MARTGLWKPITNRSDRPLTADLLGLHTIVGGAVGTWNYFDTGAGGRGVYSHFLVHGKWSSADNDGDLWQCQDTAFRAAANLDGNYRIISVETADNAARPIAPWTPAQEATIIRLMVWAHRTHGIPLVLVPDSRPGRRGVCYHAQGCDPFRVAGGELWSSARGKDCPTDARIERIPALLRAARSIVAGTVPVTTTPITEKRYLVDAADKADFKALVLAALQEERDDIAQATATRTRQVLADGRLPYGLDTLRSLLVANSVQTADLARQAGLDTALLVTELDALQEMVDDPDAPSTDA